MNKDMKKIKLSFEVNEDSFNLLKTISKMGFAEYRDHEWDTLEDFKKSDVFLDGKQTEEWFAATKEWIITNKLRANMAWSIGTELPSRLISSKLKKKALMI